MKKFKHILLYTLVVSFVCIVFPFSVWAETPDMNRSSPASTNNTNVDKQGTVIQDALLQDIRTTLKQDTEMATVRIVNAKQIDPRTLEIIANMADEAGKKVLLHADTVDDAGSIQARLFVDPAELTGLKTNLSLEIQTNHGDISQVQANFHDKSLGKPAVIRFAHQGELGARMRVAVRLSDTFSLAGVWEGDLYVYSYDMETNTYSRILSPTYYSDDNGFWHFTTNYGSFIVFINTYDGPLE